MASLYIKTLSSYMNNASLKGIAVISNHSSRFRYKSSDTSTVTANGSKLYPKASQSQSPSSPSSTDAPQPPDPLDLTFANTKEAYKSKRTWELIRGLFVLKLSSYDVIVFNHTKLIKFGRSILGPRLFRFIMKRTFYGHFVAGEDEVSIRPTLDHLRSFGVKSILDYSAEEDVTEEEIVEHEMSSVSAEKDNINIANKSENLRNQQMVDSSESHFIERIKQYQEHEEFADRRKYRPVARTYFYMNEANCEKNMETFLRCIDVVAGATYGTGFAAIKLTALGRPSLLLQLSEVIARTRNYFTQITGVEAMALGHVSPEDFQKELDTRFHVKTDDTDVKNWFKMMDYDQKGLMNLFSWNGLINMQHLISDIFKVPNLTTGRMERIITALTKEEEEMFRNMMRRIHCIAQTAKDKDVRILIDAEQTYLQPAINRITMELMRKYNKEKAIIFNTFQCYLKSAYDTATIDLDLARRQNFYFGAKLVRGAYMDQERQRAKQVGYDDPINPTFEATSEMYHKTLDFFMNKIIESGIENKKIAIMVATHNEDTVRFTIKKMHEYGILPEHRVICFGQLYGMCDQISFSLGQSGYSVYKYVPYGPIDEVLPYLSRRAVENHGILKKVSRERSLLMKELRRRITSGELFHKPIGNYRPI